MNHYKNILKLVKNEYQDHYFMDKNKGDNYVFNLCYRDPLKNKQDFQRSVLTFKNPQNPINTHSRGKNPYIADVSLAHIIDVYKHLEIPAEVLDVINYLVSSNMKKYELYLFFENIFGDNYGLKKTRFLTSSKVRVSEDFSRIDYILIDYIHDISFYKEHHTLKDKQMEGINNVSLFGKIKAYVKKKNIIIDIKNCVIFEEDENGEFTPKIKIDTFKQNDLVEIDKIKEIAKDFLRQKINDIDEFKWSLE